jgi:hypothetical protein
MHTFLSHKISIPNCRHLAHTPEYGVRSFSDDLAGGVRDICIPVVTAKMHKTLIIGSMLENYGIKYCTAVGSPLYVFRDGWVHSSCQHRHCLSVLQVNTRFSRVNSLHRDCAMCGDERRSLMQHRVSHKQSRPHRMPAVFFSRCLSI